LVNDLVEFLPNEGRIVIQSDVEELALDMVERLGEHPQLARTADHWLPESPFPAQTDRERVTLEQGLPVYRAIFVKNGA
jgi:tRNA (guanine-N7-)-methyltransferase